MLSLTGPKERHGSIESDERRVRSTQRAGAVLLAILISTSSSTAQTTRPGDEASADVKAAVAAFEGYNKALTDKDYSTLKERLVHTPFVIVDDMPRTVATVDAVVAGLRTTRERLDSAGYFTTTIDEIRPSQLRSDSVLLNCRLRHVKRDGSIIAERANFYLMVKKGGAWKLGGIILQDVEYFDK